MRDGSWGVAFSLWLSLNLRLSFRLCFSIRLWLSYGLRFSLRCSCLLRALLGLAFGLTGALGLLLARYRDLNFTFKLGAISGREVTEVMALVCWLIRASTSARADGSVRQQRLSIAFNHGA